MISWATARQAEVLAEMARRTRGDAVRFVADDVAFTLAVSRRAAERKVAFAVGLAHAPGSTVPQIRTAIRRAELTIDPEVVAVRCARARADRSVRMVPAPDSMAWITAYLPAEGAGMVMTALDALSSTCAPQDDRPMDDRRADALGDVLGAVLDRGVDLDGSDLPTRQRRRPHLQVTLGAGTLLGLDDLPAELAGYGPIPADLARRIAQDATWRVILTDPGTGEVLARGQRTYRPGADLAGAVVDRDATCTFPGCRIRADRCDIDHIEPYDPVRVETEQTRIDNLQALCRHHHRLKTSGRWSCARDPATGATTWTAPTGRTVIRAPVPVEPRFAPVGEAWPSPDPPWGDLGHH